MHADNARHHGVTAKVEDGRALVRHHIGASLDRRDLSRLEHNVLILDRGRSGAINDTHVGEDYLSGVHTDELLHRFRQFGSLGEGE